jgi:hypothetical protein
MGIYAYQVHTYVPSPLVRYPFDKQQKVVNGNMHVLSRYE